MLSTDSIGLSTLDPSLLALSSILLAISVFEVFRLRRSDSFVCCRPISYVSFRLCQLLRSLDMFGAAEFFFVANRLWLICVVHLQGKVQSSVSNVKFMSFEVDHYRIGSPFFDSIVWADVRVFAHVLQVLRCPPLISLQSNSVQEIPVGFKMF